MGNKAKYYFNEFNEETAYTLDYHIEQAKENRLSEIVLFKAIPYKENGYFWCHVIGESGEEKEGVGCGLFCNDYAPKNGKSGMCRHKSKIFYKKGERIIVNVQSGKIKTSKEENINYDFAQAFDLSKYTLPNLFKILRDMRYPKKNVLKFLPLGNTITNCPAHVIIAANIIARRIQVSPQKILDKMKQL